VTVEGFPAVPEPKQFLHASHTKEH
jgi:hypothetical protein